jgi:hypothetical protein
MVKPRGYIYSIALAFLFTLGYVFLPVFVSDSSFYVTLSNDRNLKVNNWIFTLHIILISGTLITLSECIIDRFQNKVLMIVLIIFGVLDAVVMLGWIRLFQMTN